MGPRTVSRRLAGCGVRGGVLPNRKWLHQLQWGSRPTKYYTAPQLQILLIPHFQGKHLALAYALDGF